MSARSQANLLLASLSFSILAWGASCAAPDKRPEPTPTGSLERLAELQPGDIVVAPVRNQTGSDLVPLEELRLGLSNAMVGRMYNPLDLAYVDKNWMESSFKGTPAPDGLLVMAVTDWDASHLYSNGHVAMTAELILFSGGSTTGESLWGIEISHTVDLSDGKEHPPSPSPLLMGEASKRLAEYALSTLPLRDPVAANDPNS